jgi:hypothetical protein
MDPADYGRIGTTDGPGTKHKVLSPKDHQPSIIVTMPPLSLESSIDRLYQGPLDAFVAARTALAKTLAGADAQRVKRLEKPTAVPWAVNQLYWHARPVYDRLIKAGGALRTAQIAALGGRSTDVRGAADAHRKAIAAAVAEAVQLAAAGGVQPNPDALSQTFEVLSLAATPAGAAGRMIKPLRPSGFEALAGITVKAPAHARAQSDSATEKTTSAVKSSPPRLVEDARERQRKEAAEERIKAAAIKKAEEVFERAEAAEANARAEWERRKREREAAEQALAKLR